MRIAILDYLVIPNNAIGNCDRTILKGLADEYEFTVFAVKFDNPNPDKIKFVRIPAIKRPLFALFITYHLLVPIIYWLHCWRNKVKFDVVQSIESNSMLGSLVYAHFCHRSYLKDHFDATRPSGLRGYARWLDHKLHAILEKPVFRRSKKIVVPSRGLAKELDAVYGNVIKGKVEIISNPIDIAHMRRPDASEGLKTRTELGLNENDLVVMFVALGHFERKGLLLLLEAAALLKDERVKLLIVGGNPAVIADYGQRATVLGLAPNQVIFTGLKKDIRPYLWAADVFTLPSAYEVFPLVSLEAAAAGLPLLVSRIHGVEEFLEDGVNGWCVDRKPEALADKIRFSLDNRPVLKEMGQRAAESVRQYDSNGFIDRWRKFYGQWA